MSISTSLHRAVALVCLVTGGCGTCITLQDNAEFPNQVYAGTRLMSSNLHGWPDVPFSAVADTVVLPYTIPWTIYNHDHPPATQPDTD